MTGSNSGTWGSDLNTNDITITDSILGKTLAVSLASSNVDLTTTQRQNLAFALSGTLSADITITIPLNFNSATVACGGSFIFNNQTTGAHSVTVKTVASGSTGVTVFQGVRAILYSDGTNVYNANDGGLGTASKILTYPGNPNGVVSCNPGSATMPADVLWDRVDDALYVCTGGTSWANVTAAASSPIPSGSIMLFQQTAAPSGWTKITTYTDVGLRVVSGAVTTVTNQSAFSTVFVQTATGAHALVTSELPSHQHGLTNTVFINLASTATSDFSANSPAQPILASSGLTDAAGGGGTHTHTIALNLNYIDLILAQKV